MVDRDRNDDRDDSDEESASEERNESSSGSRSGGGSDRPRRSYQRGRPRSRIKACRFCTDKSKVIDYKDIDLMYSLTNPRGRILPRRKTGTCAKHQRQVSLAIKRARHMAMLPYSAQHVRQTNS